MGKYWPLFLILVLCEHGAHAHVVVKNLEGVYWAEISGENDISFLKKALEKLDFSHLLPLFGWIDCGPKSRRSCKIGLDSRETFFVSLNNGSLKAKIGDFRPNALELVSFTSSDKKLRIWCDPEQGLLYQNAQGNYSRKPECYVAISLPN